MKKIIFLIFVLLVICDSTYSQRKFRKPHLKIHELTFGVGATNFLGELGGANRIGSGKFSYRDFDFPSIKPMINIGYRFQWHKNWAVRTELNAGFIGGNDKYTK